MKLWFVRLTFCCLLGIVLTGCVRKSSPDSLRQPGIDQSTPDYVIRYGYSLGECEGYCTFEFTIDQKQIVFEKRKAVLTGQPDDIMTQQKPIEVLDWQRLAKSIDQKKLTEISDTIGCPGCTDTGAFWLEVNEGSFHKKVTWNAGKLPSELDDINLRISNILEKSGFTL